MAGEKNLQTKILNDLRSYGRNIVVTKIERCSDNAVPDIFFTTLFTGAIFIEVKNDGEKPRKNQVLMMKKLRKCGVEAYACSTWEEWVKIKKHLKLTPKSVGHAASLFKSNRSLF